MAGRAANTFARVTGDTLPVFTLLPIGACEDTFPVYTFVTRRAADTFTGISRNAGSTVTDLARLAQ